MKPFDSCIHIGNIAKRCEQLRNQGTDRELCGIAYILYRGKYGTKKGNIIRNGCQTANFEHSGQN